MGLGAGRMQMGLGDGKAPPLAFVWRGAPSACYVIGCGFIRGRVLVRVTVTEFIQDYGRLSDRAITEPVTLTRDGRDRLVVLSIEEYERLTRRDRIVIGVEDLTEAEIALIEQAEVPAEYAYLDAELDHPTR